MSGLKKVMVFVVPIAGILFLSNAFAETAFERPAKSISKTYDNGDSLEMTCKGVRNEKCLLAAKIGGVKRKFILNFASNGYVPTLDFIRMIGASYKPWASGVAISVECGRRDEEVLPEGVPSATCYVYLSLNGNGEVTWQEFIVVGQLMPQAID